MSTQALTTTGQTGSQLANVEQSLQSVEIQTDAGPVRLTPTIVRKYLAVGQKDKISDQDITLFMAMCKFNGLNPFLREAWLIKYGETTQMIVAKEAFVKRAAEDPDCEDWKAGIIVWDKEHKKYFDTAGLIPPEHELLGGWCEVKMKGRPLFRVEVNLDEYVGSNQQMWGARGKQSTMIRKVALVHALREAMPSRTKRMYIPDEIGLDPDKLPEGAIDVDQVQHDTTPPADKPNGNGTPEEETAPSGGLQRRSRRNKFTGLDKNIFPGGKIETCGIKPDQILELKRLAGIPENAAQIKSYLAFNVGYPELSYLREDEALNLSGRLQPLRVEVNPAEEVFDPPDSAFDQPVNDPVPTAQAQAPEVPPEEKVFCPFTKETTYKSWCLHSCKTRAADGFCIALGEKPPRSDFMGGQS